MSENTKQIQSLLDSVSNVIQKHETQANYTGENYNIFSIMGMETDEEFTHSRIIGNLLNPKGKHGCGDFFLKSFVEKLNILFEENNLHDMKLEDFGPLVNERITERYAGEVNCKTISGGSIDLVIEDSKQILLIENKIYAADQKYQLARYYNYAKTRGNKKIVMLYLTLDGKNLSDNEGNIVIKEDKVYNIPSIVNLDENAIKLESLELKFPIDQNTFDGINIENKCFYTPISYKTFIKEWLEASFFFVDNRPMIYYPIKHYYNLIKKLTNQTTSKIMEKEIFEKLLQNENNIESIKYIAENYQNFKKNIIEDFFRTQFKILQEHYNYDKKVKTINTKRPLNFWQNHIQTETMSVKRFSLSFIFEGYSSYNKLCIQLIRQTEGESIENEEILIKNFLNQLKEHNQKTLTHTPNWNIIAMEFKDNFLWDEDYEILKKIQLSYKFKDISEIENYKNSMIYNFNEVIKKVIKAVEETYNNI
jgi:hypothetical protein